MTTRGKFAPRLPGATLRRQLAFEPTGEQWDAIQAAFGAPLHEGDREAVHDAVAALFTLEEAVEAAPRISDAEEVVARMSGAVKALQSAIAWPESDGQFDVRNMVETMLDDELEASCARFSDLEQFARAGGVRSGHALFLASIMLDEALGRVRGRLDALRSDAESGGSLIERGEGWSVFVARLCEFFADHGKPVTRRKDSDKNKTGRASHFVGFVAAIMDAFPEAMQPAYQSEEALAQRIDRAISGRKRGRTAAD
jgi:hypothetical protein